MEDLHLFNAIDGRIDLDNGVIKGVSLITMGDARGHGLVVDDVTLSQLKDSLESTPSPGIKAKLNHRSGVEAVFGYINNFQVKGNKLTGDLNMLQNHKDYNQTMEQISTMPGQIGLSVAFQGDKEKQGDKTYARCKRIISVDLVADPAANPDGMFETKVDNQILNMDNPESEGQLSEVELLQQINDRLENLEGFQGDLEEAIADQLSDDDSYEESYDDSGDNDYDDGYAEEDSEYAVEVDGTDEQQYSSINDALTFLESKAQGALQAEQDFQEEKILSDIETKFEELKKENEELRFANENLEEAIELSGVNALPSSAIENLFSTDKGEGSFEFSIQQAATEVDDHNEAIRKAVEMNPRAHQDWLLSQGVYEN